MPAQSTSAPPPGVSALTVQRVERASGTLATCAVTSMERLTWFRRLPAEQRSWVGVVAQAGIAAFVAWLQRPRGGVSMTAEVFGAAPRELARAISLQHTVELVRTTIDVVETQVSELAAPGDEHALREAMLRFSREIAFAAALVYAQAAEERGAWDARLEALVVDALLRGEASDEIRSRAAALGWGAPTEVCVLVGTPQAGEPEAVLDSLQRAARAEGLDVLAAIHGDRLVVILGGAEDPLTAVRGVLAEFAPGPVVVGPAVSDLTEAARSAEQALSGLRAAAAWPNAPRPVWANDLLPERAIDGDTEARGLLVEKVYRPLEQAGGALLDTVAAYLESGGSLEATARRLFVHSNTVRYRLRRAAELTGYLPTNARDAFVLQVALALGRIETGLPSL